MGCSASAWEKKSPPQKKSFIFLQHVMADLKIAVIFESEFKKRKFLCKPTSSDSLLTSSVMGVIYFPEHRFKLVNRLKSRQGAFKICRDKRDDVKVALV